MPHWKWFFGRLRLERGKTSRYLFGELSSRDIGTVERNLVRTRGGHCGRRWNKQSVRDRGDIDHYCNVLSESHDKAVDILKNRATAHRHF